MIVCSDIYWGTIPPFPPLTSFSPGLIICVAFDNDQGGKLLRFDFSIMLKPDYYLEFLPSRTVRWKVAYVLSARTRLEERRSLSSTSRQNVQKYPKMVFGSACMFLYSTTVDTSAHHSVFGAAPNRTAITRQTRSRISLPICDRTIKNRNCEYSCTPQTCLTSILVHSLESHELEKAQAKFCQGDDGAPHSVSANNSFSIKFGLNKHRDTLLAPCHQPGSYAHPPPAHTYTTPIVVPTHATIPDSAGLLQYGDDTGVSETLVDPSAIPYPTDPLCSLEDVTSSEQDIQPSNLGFTSNESHLLPPSLSYSDTPNTALAVFDLTRVANYIQTADYAQPQAQPDDYIPDGSMDVQDLSLYKLDQESPGTSLPISTYSSLAGWNREWWS